MDEDAKKIILARRARFVAAALASLGVASQACGGRSEHDNTETASGGVASTGGVGAAGGVGGSDGPLPCLGVGGSVNIDTGGSGGSGVSGIGVEAGAAGEAGAGDGTAGGDGAGGSKAIDDPGAAGEPAVCLSVPR